MLMSSFPSIQLSYTITMSEFEPYTLREWCKHCTNVLNHEFQTYVRKFFHLSIFSVKLAHKQDVDV